MPKEIEKAAGGSSGLLGDSGRSPQPIQVLDQKSRELAEKEARERVKGLRQPIVRKVGKGDKRFKRYFDEHASSHYTAENVVTACRDCDSLYLYESARENGGRLNHVIWAPTTVLSFQPVPRTLWSKLTSKPEVLEQVNTTLIDCYNTVLDFYPWTRPKKGFFIEDGGTRFGLEEGNAFVGMRVNYLQLVPLIDAVESRDNVQIERQKKFLASCMVHELTHGERGARGIDVGSQSEVASHTIQFIFDPTGNQKLYDELGRSLTHIRENRIPKEGQKPLDHYDRDQYSSLLIIADTVAEHNPEYKRVLGSDKDPNKLNALRQVVSFVTPEVKEYFTQNLVPEIMAIDEGKLRARAVDIEHKWGILPCVIKL